jgi:hypothetical protein
VLGWIRQTLTVRQLYTEIAGKFVMGTPTDYAQRLMFEPATGYVGNPDEGTAPM